MSENEVVKKLKDRLNKNNIDTKIDFKHELREITQELIVAGLSEAGFFNKAVFHGGTSLRMIYKINRYSEDLDFMLLEKDKDFRWKSYLDDVKSYVGQYGCLLETVDKSKIDTNVQKAFIKDSSIEQMMNMSWTRRSGTPEKINIKLETDTNPPLYSNNEIKEYLFPKKYSINVQDLSSLFAGKCHALLCRKYVKGRDWFDLNWFVNKGIEPNYKYLDAMLKQQGPWEGKNNNSNKEWICNELFKKIEILNFEEVNMDINRFANKNSYVNYDKNFMKKTIQLLNSERYGQSFEEKGNSR
jgi:predicted nucleotidyltransferase component of viral defense system